MRNLILWLVVVFVAVSCSRDKNPLNTGLPGNGAGVLSIQTDQVSYTWVKGEDNLHVYLNGTVTNNSNYHLYSRISPNPEFVSLDEPFCVVAGNSWGQVEKYNAATDAWENTEIEGMLIEGSSFMTLEAQATYPLNGPLSSRSDNRESGLYRIVVEYSFEQNPDKDARKFRDYSNTFEIK
jgi:hypothetical protein